MTSASRAPGLMDHCLEQLPAMMAPLQVTEGWPGNKVEREFLALMGVETDQNLDQMPPLEREETGKLHLWLAVTLAGKDATDVRRRAYGFADQIAEWAQADFTFGGTVCWGFLVPTTWTPGIADTARDGVLQLELRFTEYAL